jgi:hypothetical protein
VGDLKPECHRSKIYVLLDEQVHVWYIDIILRFKIYSSPGQCLRPYELLPSLGWLTNHILIFSASVGQNKTKLCRSEIWEKNGYGKYHEYSTNSTKVTKLRKTHWEVTLRSSTRGHPYHKMSSEWPRLNVGEINPSHSTMLNQYMVNSKF